MAELKTRLEHLDEALTTGHLALNSALSSDTVRVWETNDRRTMLTLHAVDAVGRIVARASTKYDGNIHQWMVFRHVEHEAIARVLEALGFVETPEDEQDGPSMADAMDEIESIGETPAGGTPSVERLAEILWTGRKKALDLADIPLRDLDLHVQEQYVRYAAAVAEQLGSEPNVHLDEVNDLHEFLGQLLDMLPGATDEGMDAMDQIPRAIEKLKGERQRSDELLVGAHLDLCKAVDTRCTTLAGAIEHAAAVRAEAERLRAERAEVRAALISELRASSRFRKAWKSARRGRRSARLLNHELVSSLRLVRDERDEARRRIALALTTAAELHQFNSPDGDHLDGCPGCRLEDELNGGAR